MRTEALYDAKLFFELPVATLTEEGIMPIESRDQPLGFNDSRGNWWVAILDQSNQLKRKVFIP